MRIRPALLVAGAVLMLSACGAEQGHPITETAATSSGNCPGCGARIEYTYSHVDGTAVEAADLDRPRQMIAERLAAHGIDGKVTIDGSRVVAELHDDDGTGATEFGRVPRMDIRSVLSSLPATAADGTSGTATATASPTPSGDGGADDADPRRQSAQIGAQQSALQALDCTRPDPLRGRDDPARPLVTCSSDGTQKYVLGPSLMDGTDIAESTATADHDANSVMLRFKSADKWAHLTESQLYQQIAFTVDTAVISAPTVQTGPQLGGITSITGHFTTDEAKELARAIERSASPLRVSAAVTEVSRPTR
ncbi:putative protein translocase subunit SecD [Nocardia nova SH22a]|uniref:SecDF P1 head subdomain domain-containing protein n=1 Tax=Nocardia nova SH22a TaxID=1415166 RepID=W5TLL0_9NOCA|nr:hypothetical protein [Nocardia nova]AHH20240.1 putative protein translocase subunit SecD [Nocardia nova SH22a]